MIAFKWIGMIALAVSLAVPSVTTAKDLPPPDSGKDKIVDGLPISLQPWRDPDDP